MHWFIITIFQIKMSNTNMIILESPEECERRRLQIKGISDYSSKLSTDTELLSVLGNAVLFDAKGRPHKFSDICESSKQTVIVFLRHFCDYIAIEYAEDLAKCVLLPLKDKNINFVPVSYGDCALIEEFEKATGLRRVFTDPQRVLYTNLSFHHGIDYFSASSSSHHVKSSMFGGIVSSTIRAATNGLIFPGDLNQQGGVLMLDNYGQNVCFIHRDCGPFDHLSVRCLLEKTGITDLSQFSNVQTL